MPGQFFGNLLRRTLKRGSREDEQSVLGHQVEELIAGHRLEVERYLQGSRRGSILRYVQNLANTYTKESLREFHMYAPELLSREYAEAYNLDSSEHLRELEKVRECFKDAVFLGRPLGSIYEFEDEEELQDVSWDDLWSACGRAFELETKRRKYRNLNIAFSDEAQTLGCFVATVLIASDLGNL